MILELRRKFGKTAWFVPAAKNTPASVVATVVTEAMMVEDLYFSSGTTETVLYAGSNAPEVVLRIADAARAASERADVYEAENQPKMAGLERSRARQRRTTADALLARRRGTWAATTVAAQHAE